MRYLTEPGIIGSLTEIIVSKPRKEVARDRKRIRFISSYQGEVDYEMHGLAGRLHFRWAKVPWGWSWHQGRRYWNFDSEEEFDRVGPNASWGILHNGGKKVPAEVLEIFRDEHCGDAVMGCCNAETGWLWRIADHELHLEIPRAGQAPRQRAVGAT